MSNGRAKGVLAQYNTFLYDFIYNDKYFKEPDAMPRDQWKQQIEDYNSWSDVLNAPKQKEVPIKEEGDESRDHWRGKRNMVDLFQEYNERSYRFLIWTERQQLKKRYIEPFGDFRTYRPDIVVFDRIGFSKNHPHYGIYILEIDGRKNHTNKNEVWKGTVRDEFFFDFYNAVTIRIPTWRAHGRQRTYNEFQDLHEEMIYTCNLLQNQKDKRDNN